MAAYRLNVFSLGRTPTSCGRARHDCRAVSPSPSWAMCCQDLIQGTCNHLYVEMQERCCCCRCCATVADPDARKPAIALTNSPSFTYHSDKDFLYGTVGWASFNGAGRSELCIYGAWIDGVGWFGHCFLGLKVHLIATAGRAYHRSQHAGKDGVGKGATGKNAGG